MSGWRAVEGLVGARVDGGLGAGAVRFGDGVTISGDLGVQQQSRRAGLRTRDFARRSTADQVKLRRLARISPPPIARRNDARKPRATRQQEEAVVSRSELERRSCLVQIQPAQHW